MIKVWDYDKLIADVEMIDGKLHLISYKDSLRGFEDLRRGIAERMNKPVSEVSDQELYDDLPRALNGIVWAQRID
jgi:hypothetical protein